MACPKCGDKWLYTVEFESIIGCETCGPENNVIVTRECATCRRPSEPITQPVWRAPQEFSSPEMDEWFDKQQGGKE